MRTGVVVSAGFILLRASNIYGNPGDWSAQKTLAMTVVSFLNVQKYPPSLLYLMMTLGPAMLLLGAWERFNAEPGTTALPHGKLVKAVITFGRVPLFFYLLQWPTAHAAGYLLTLFTLRSTTWLFELSGFGTPPPPTAGFDLWVVYVAWIVGVILLYPLCRWYAGVKARRRDWWLSYL